MHTCVIDQDVKFSFCILDSSFRRFNRLQIGDVNLDEFDVEIVLRLELLSSSQQK